MVRESVESVRGISPVGKEKVYGGNDLAMQLQRSAENLTCFNVDYIIFGYFGAKPNNYRSIYFSYRPSVDRQNFFSRNASLGLQDVRACDGRHYRASLSTE